MVTAAGAAQTQAAPRPYPTMPTAATVPEPTQGLTAQPVQFQPSAPQEPPPPYPGTQNTYPVQPQPLGGGAQYSGYPPVHQENAPYPTAPYQLYAEAPPTAPAPAPYPVGAPPIAAVVASAPPPQPSTAYQQSPQQGIELQQYAATTTTMAAAAAQSATMPPYPPNMPGQAVYPNEPAYPSAPGMAPYPTTVMASDPNQGYLPPPTN